ncbi:hypothetical protein [Bacillus sp. UMB0728]|uniref:hypothetical protein n=1 Tax=Bacillus sp. UMB0728 TaxID=2066052 RepID=UPI000C77ECAA|nr:hypothetical protein [Bacillus sp. UMB0728]PLR72339.1 hypothetical protein CYJ37_12345 [Bacillus sp. UMB0728]
MSKNLINKLSSRKFWALLAGFIGSLLVAFNMGENDIAQVTAIISAFGSVAVYIFAEASVDKAALKNENEEEK